MSCYVQHEKSSIVPTAPDMRSHYGRADSSKPHSVLHAYKQCHCTPRSYWTSLYICPSKQAVCTSHFGCLVIVVARFNTKPAIHDRALLSRVMQHPPGRHPHASDLSASAATIGFHFHLIPAMLGHSRAFPSLSVFAIFT